MKTRTLLLLAIGCGLAILVAGGIQLLRISGEPATSTALPVGATAQAGGMRVTVVGARAVGDVAVVTVRLGGVVDDDVSAGFLLNAGAPVDSSVAPDQRCGAVGVEPSTCALAFDLSGRRIDGAVLVYRRGADTARWALHG